MTESVWQVYVGKDHFTHWAAPRQIYTGTSHGQCSFEREVACELGCINLLGLASTTQGRDYCTASTLLFVFLSDTYGMLDQLPGTTLQGP